MFPLLVPHQFPAPVGEGKGVGSVLFSTHVIGGIFVQLFYITVPHPSPFTVICMKGILLTPPLPLPYRGGEPTRDGAVHHFSSTALEDSLVVTISFITFATSPVEAGF